MIVRHRGEQLRGPDDGGQRGGEGGGVDAGKDEVAGLASWWVAIGSMGYIRLKAAKEEVAAGLL